MHEEVSSPNPHDWNSGHFANSALEILVACRHDVAFVLLDAVHKAVISVCAFVLAGHALESRVLGNSEAANRHEHWLRNNNECGLECDFVGLAKLLQLAHDAIRDGGNACENVSVCQ